jgi:hypothetical protein
MALLVARRGSARLAGDCRLTAQRDVRAAMAFLKRECENARLYQPRLISTDKTYSYDRVIGDMNRFELPSEGILQINRKWGNNRIEGDRAALKELIILMCGFRSLTSAKATLHGIEAIRTIKRDTSKASHAASQAKPALWKASWAWQPKKPSGQPKNFNLKYCNRSIWLRVRYCEIDLTRGGRLCHNGGAQVKPS